MLVLVGSGFYALRLLANVQRTCIYMHFDEYEQLEHIQMIRTCAIQSRAHKCSFSTLSLFPSLSRCNTCRRLSICGITYVCSR